MSTKVVRNAEVICVVRLGQTHDNQFTSKSGIYWNGFCNFKATFLESPQSFRGNFWYSNIEVGVVYLLERFCLLMG